jgi:hypothetical protein
MQVLACLLLVCLGVKKCHGLGGRQKSPLPRAGILTCHGRCMAWCLPMMGATLAGGPREQVWHPLLHECHMQPKQ